MTIAVNRNLTNCENSPKKSHSVFHSFHGLMNSINWPASSVWVFIAQLGEHCSANAEATGSNPVEAPKIFFSGYFRNCLNCDSLRWSHTHFMSFYISTGLVLYSARTKPIRFFHVLSFILSHHALLCHGMQNWSRTLFGTH